MLAKQKLAAERARLLLGCYRRIDAQDPDTYVMAIALVLTGYDDQLICEATHPRTGIQATEKFKSWPPNVGELKEFCESLRARNARNAAWLAARLVPPAISPDVDRSANPTREEIEQKYPWLVREKTPPPTRESALQRLGEIVGRPITQAEFDAIPDAKKAG